APRVVVRVEVEGAERYLDLQGPPDHAALYPRVPDAVPLAVIAVEPQQRVGHQARRVHLEEVAGAAVEERVNCPHEGVVGEELLVASELPADPPVSCGVEAGDAQVQRLTVEDDAHLRPLGGGAAVGRIDLNEIRGGY